MVGDLDAGGTKPYRARKGVPRVSFRQPAKKRIVVPVLDHDIEPMALAGAPKDFQYLPHTGAEADPVLAVEGHLLRHRRRSVLVEVPLALQIDGEPFG